MKRTILVGVLICCASSLCIIAGSVYGEASAIEQERKSKITEDRALSQTSAFYRELRYAAVSGNINTDGDTEYKWSKITMESAKLPNEPLRFGWNAKNDDPFIESLEYIQSYEDARIEGKVLDVVFTVTPKAERYGKPSFSNTRSSSRQGVEALEFHFDFWHIIASKKITLSDGKQVALEDEVFVRADNGLVAYVKNQYVGGDYVPSSYTALSTSSQADISQILLDASIAYSNSHFYDSYKLYSDALAAIDDSTYENRITAADAAYCLAALLWEKWGSIKDRAKLSNSERKKMIGNCLSYASRNGSWHISELSRIAIYNIEGGMEP